MQRYDIIMQEANRLRGFSVSKFILDPESWNMYPNRIELAWSKIQFSEDTIDSVPNDTYGVYSFVVLPDVANHSDCSYLLYVGKTHRSFSQRYKEYVKSSKGTGRVHIYNMLNNWEGYLWFCFAPIDDPDQIQVVEDDLLRAFRPPYNRAYPADIREPMKVL